MGLNTILKRNFGHCLKEVEERGGRAEMYKLRVYNYVNT